MVSVKLVRRAQTGDLQAQAELYETMYKRVYYLALRMTRRAEDAEDVTQEAFLSAFHALPNLADPNAFEGWLFQITANQSRKLLRKNSRLTDLPEDEDGRTMLDDLPDEDEALIPASAVEKESERQILLELIDALPEEQRQCVYLFYFAQMSVKQIAETLECTEGTAKSRLNYARQKLRAAVLATEERDGIRLHSLAPLGLLLLKDYQFATSELAVPVLGGAAAGAAGSAAARTTAGTASAAGTAVKTGILTAAKTKIVAGVAAAVIVLGGGAAVLTNLPAETAKPTEPSETVEESVPVEQPAETTLPENEAAQEAMTFADPAMEANLRILLEIPEGPIYPEDAERVFTVYLFDNGMEIEQLDDYDPMVKSAPREGTTAVTNLADLKQFPLPLTVYDYTSDPALLRTLQALEDLDSLVMFNDAKPISDVSFLTELPALRQLELVVADGTDLSAVEQCKTLQRLKITSTGAISLDPSGLEQLLELELASSGSGVLDLQLSQSMPSLQILALRYGQLPGLGLLSNLSNVQALVLEGPNFRQLDLNQLSLAPSLRCLTINDTSTDGNNEPLDLAPLAACPALEVCTYLRSATVNAPEHIVFLEEGAEPRRTEIMQEILQQSNAW